MNLIELTHKNDILQTYEIYKHCMFMPTEEKFNKKVEQFLNNNSVKIFACFSHGKIVGVMAVSFIEQKKVEILGIAVDLSARGKGIGSYMIKQVINNYDLLSVYAETDNDAVGFYQKNNFSITEFSEIYDGETVIRYKCELTQFQQVEQLGNLNLTEGDMLAQNKSGWKLIKYIDIKEEDIGQYHNVTGRYLLNYESVDFTGFS